jgi:nucleoside-diphosphate-sugar epimerase
MRTLVVGGTGFLGAKVIRRLIEQGDDLICFDLFTSTPRLADIASKVCFVQGDIAAIDEIIAAIREHKADRIIHLAYLKTAEAENQLQRAMRINVVGTSNVFEAARLTGMKRVVYVSSIGYYGLQSSFGERPVTEEDRGVPVTVYGHTKGLNEYVAKRYADLYGLEAVCLRLAFSFGHGRGDVGNLWPTTFASNPAVGKPASLPRDASRKYCMIYIDDAVDILCALANREKLDHRVYLSGGYTVTLEELVHVVKELIPGAEFRYDGKEGDHHYVYLLDDSRLVRELGKRLPPMRRRILDHINEARCSAGLPEIRDESGSNA